MNSNQNPTTYNIDISPIGDHLQVSIPELGIVLETEPGETKLDDAELIALAAISRYERQQYEKASRVKAS